VSQLLSRTGCSAGVCVGISDGGEDPEAGTWRFPLENQISTCLATKAAPPFEKLPDMLLNHLEGILCCRTNVPLGTAEPINGNIKSPLRGRGYKTSATCCSKPKRLAATETEFVVLRKAAKEEPFRVQKTRATSR
jgi:hypothetical protein